MGKPKLDEPTELKVFISHASEEKAIAGGLKESLDCCGVNAFVAHDDIETGTKWDEEILDQLRQCDAFVVILTENSKNSQYVNQEIGYALARRVPIIPLKVPIDPWCFISNIQGMKLEVTQKITQFGLIESYNYHDSAIAIVEGLMRRLGLHAAIKASLLRGLKSSSNVVETAAKARLLKACESLSSDDALSIVEAALENKNVSDSFATPALIKKLMDEHPDAFDENRIVALKGKGFLRTGDSGG